MAIATYQRGPRIDRAISRVLSQEGAPSFEVVVVDDGSTDDTSARLARWADDPRVTVVRQRNGGLGMARRTGAERSTGAWLVFLDDDDVPGPNWLATLAGLIDHGVGLVRIGCRIVDGEGREVGREVPGRGNGVGNIRGPFLPGTWAVRRDVYDASGGFLAGLGFSLQTEVGERLLQVCRERALAVRSTSAVPFAYVRLPSSDRPFHAPLLLFDNSRWLLERLPDVWKEHPSSGADVASVGAVNAARLDRWPEARRLLWHAVCRDPRRPIRWGRLALAAVPPLARRQWGRADGFQAASGRRGLLVHGRPHPQGGPQEDLLFLPWRYEEGTGPTAGVRLVGAPGASPASHRLVPCDSEALLAPGRLRAGSVIDTAGLLSRVADPRRLLGELRDALPDGGKVLVATAAPRDPIGGPPLDFSLRRTWRRSALVLLAEAEGFTVGPERWLDTARAALGRPLPSRVAVLERPPDAVR